MPEPRRGGFFPVLFVRGEEGSEKALIAVLVSEKIGILLSVAGGCVAYLCC